MSALDDLILAKEMIEGVKRVVICHPRQVDALTREVEEAGLAGLVSIVPSDRIPDENTMYVGPKVVVPGGRVPKLRH